MESPAKPRGLPCPLKTAMWEVVGGRSSAVGKEQLLWAHGDTQARDTRLNALIGGAVKVEAEGAVVI